MQLRRGIRSKPVHNVPLRCVPPHVRAKVMLVWMKSTAYRAVSYNVLREVAKYLSLHRVLTWMSDRGTFTFDVATMKATKVTISPSSQVPRAVRCATATCIGDDLFFVCGGYNRQPTRKTILIDHCMVRQLPPMMYHHHRHAIVYYEPTLTIFVFGGGLPSAQNQHVCEKFSLLEAKWSRIASMTYSRDTASAALHSSSIYVCNGSECGVYDIQADTFTPLPVFAASDQSYVLVMAVVEDDLVIIGNTVVIKWSIPQHTVKERKQVAMVQLIHPLDVAVAGNCVWYTSEYLMACMKVDIEAGEITTIAF